MVFLAFYHFVLIAFIRFPFSLMVIVCFPKCSRTGDTHTHTYTYTWMPSSMFERVKNRDDESATCLFNYLHRPDLLKHRIAKRRIFFTQMGLKNRTEPNRRLFFTFCIPWTQFVFFVSFADDSSVSCDSLVLRHTHTAMFDENETRFLSCLLLTYLHKNIVILFGWIHDDVIA